MNDGALPDGIRYDEYTGSRGGTMTNVNLSDGEWKIMNVLWEKEGGGHNHGVDGTVTG